MKQFAKVTTDSQLSGIIRTNAEDFKVDEILSFKPSGQGEHVFLQIQKTGENTDWVAGKLAKIAGVKRRDVSYAGLKDRHAVTTQWFSVWMPGKDAPDWHTDLPKSVQLIVETRHDRKLKRGALNGNKFCLIIRDFKDEQSALISTIQQIKQQGVPNYFGEQRFGRGGFNVDKAKQWFEQEFKIKDRQKRSIYLSAARSWIFNHTVSERVKQGTWNQALEGDVFMLGNSNACFCESLDDEIIQRVDAHEIHPSAPLWGKGELLSKEAVLAFESSLGEVFPVLCQGLEKHGLKQQRRALRLSVKDIDYTKEEDVLELRFSLPSGTYATSVLRELGNITTS